MTVALRPYVLSRVAAQQQKILECESLRELVGEELKGSRFDLFVRGLLKCLPQKIPRELIEQSVQHLVDRRLTEELLEEEAWRLGGNVRRLRDLKPAPPWGGQPVPEWVPVQIVGGEYYRTKRSNKAGMIYRFQVLAGTPCPEVIERFWSRSFCRLVASRIGFSKPWGARPFKDFLQLFNLRLYVLVDGESCRDGKPGFGQVADEQPAGVIKWNRDILRLRQRAPGSGFSCREGYPNRFPCYRCHVGLDLCPAATHAETFVSGSCPECGSDPAWFYPGETSRCVDCDIRWRWRPIERHSGK